jgi:rhamnosyltransferase
MSDRAVTIVLRSFNEGWALKDTLQALKTQRHRWELIAFDSGSTDGSVELLRAAKPRELIQLSASEYVPGRVLNHGMRLSQSNEVIFLNADATPQGADWLGPLVRALNDPLAAAVFSRQTARPDCRAVYACDYERCFGENRESASWDHFFSMVSSGLRRDIWEKRGFLENIQYAEDDEYTRWARGQGYKVVYVPESIVIHSHNYTPAQAYKRSFGDARAMAASWPGKRSDFNLVRTLLLGWLNDLRRDALFCMNSGRMGEFPHAARVRWSQRRGKLDGFQSGWKDYRGTAA